MDPALLTEVLEVVEQIVPLLIKYGPNVIVGIEQIWENLAFAIKCLKSGEPLSDADRKQIRANLDAIDAKLAAAIEAAEAEDDGTAAAGNAGTTGST